MNKLDLHHSISSSLKPVSGSISDIISEIDQLSVLSSDEYLTSSPSILYSIANTALYLSDKYSKFPFDYSVIYLSELYKAKNFDYGDSFCRVRSKVPKAILVRLYDKAYRADTLLSSNSAQVNESLYDTLVDLANYAILELIEIYARQGSV